MKRFMGVVLATGLLAASAQAQAQVAPRAF